MLVIKYKEGSVYKNLNPFFTNIEYDYVLDQVGAFQFQYPLADSLADKLIFRREIQIFQDAVLLFSGKILKVTDNPTAEVPTRTVSGVSLLEEFANEITLPNILYQNEPVEDVLDPTYIKTFIKPSTWATQVEPTSEDITYLSSLQSPLALFNLLNRQIGFHFRYIGTAITPRLVEFGTFGSTSSVRIRALPKSHLEAGEDNLVIVSDGITQTLEGQDVVNRVYPLGGGGDNGVNQLTLRDVDLGQVDPFYPVFIDADTPNTDAIYDPTIYTNTKTAPNTFQAFYLKDQDSIDNYGEIKKPIVFSDIYPNPTSGDQVNNADRIRAATELYKAARQYLIKNKEPKRAYEVTCWGTTDNLFVGDKVNLKFKGLISKVDPDGTASRTFADIDEDFYIISYKVTFLDGGVRQYVLQLSNIDELPKRDNDLLVDLVQQVQTETRQRTGSVTTYPVYYTDSFDSGFPAQFLLWIPNETVYVDYLKLKIRVRPFRAYEQAVQGGGATTQSTSSGGGTSQSSTSGGSHSHNVSIPNHSHNMGAISTVGGFYPATDGFPGGAGTRSATFQFAGGQQIGVYAVAASGGQSTGAGGASIQTSTSAGNHSHSVTIPNHTHNVTLPNHTHAIQFGIFEDVTPPANVRILIDGIDYSSQLGTYSSFGYFPSTLGESFDLLAAASALGQLDNLLAPGEHQIEVRCTSGRARIELSIYNQFYLSSR